MPPLTPSARDRKLPRMTNTRTHRTPDLEKSKEEEKAVYMRFKIRFFYCNSK
jgi:hypothetical protein